MLFLAQALLKAAGVEYDDLGETWVVRVPPRSVVIECDEAEAYVLQSLLEVQHVLNASGCPRISFSINGRCLGLGELAATA